MKIIIIQLGRIGDMILLTPMFKIIAENYPTAELSVIASRHNFSILKNNPYVKKIFIYNKKLPELAKFYLQIKKHNFDYLIDPKDHFSRESRILARIIKAKTKIGFNATQKKIYDLSIPSEKENENLHFTQRVINTLKFLNIKVPNYIPKPDLYADSHSEAYTEKFLTSLNDNNKSKRILINISASQEKKMWENEKWVELINWLSSKNFQTILINAPPEREKAKFILENCERLHHFNSRSILDAISIVKRVDLLITPDTSFVHIAGGFDIPIFGLYSGLDDFFAKFYPLSSTYKVVRASKGFDGIKDISSQKAIAELEDFLNQLGFFQKC